MGKEVTFTTMSQALIEDGDEESVDAILGVLACAEKAAQRVEMYCDGKASEADLMHSDNVMQSAVNAVITRYCTIEVNAKDGRQAERADACPSQSGTPMREGATFTAMSVALLRDRSDENMDVVLGVLACAEENTRWVRLSHEGKEPYDDMVEAHFALMLAVDALVERYRALQ